MKRSFLGTKAIIALIGICFLFLTVTGFSFKDFKLKKPQPAQESQDLLEQSSENFGWWPTDAKPAPVKDEGRGGYWWWPEKAGSAGAPLWGNRGYVYLYKVIFDYNAEELPAPQPQEKRPSLLIKKIIKNVKIYFDFNKSDIREDAAAVLDSAVATLKRNPKADILITGNCDARGPESYNEKLGRRRASSVKDYLLNQGVPDEHIRIISRGKLDAVAPITDVVGMQKDRNAQFMIAEVEEVMIPYPEEIPKDAKMIGESRFVEEKEVEMKGEIKAYTKEYTIKKGDTLWDIAQKELGSGHRWKYLYELNKDRIKNPDKLKAGTKILIPVE